MDAAQKRHYSLARLTHHWYVACRADQLRQQPLRFLLNDTPLVLFRGPNGPSALLDRCAHRNVPLSGGSVKNGCLVCPYHGWEYDSAGVCQKVPALVGIQTGKGRRVPHYLAQEKAGYIWVYGTPDVEPQNEPFALPYWDDRSYGQLRYEGYFEASLHATLENILDVPHTAFLHKGLFRGVKSNQITAVVRRGADRVEAEYVGEPRPEGVLGRLLAPQGGTVTHFDRFFLPAIAQVEYRLGEKNHVLITNCLTPESDFRTKLHALVSFKTIFPEFLVKTALLPLGKKVIQQDQVILRQQTETIEKFGGEQYVSTDVDLLGPHIWRLLKHAEKNEPAEPWEGTFQLVA